MTKRAFIFSSGKYKAEDCAFYSRIKYNCDDLIICADGGYDIVCMMGKTPDVVIGDMDSIKTKVPSIVKTIVYPKEKDKTDLHLCIDYALEKGITQIIIFGGVGGRLDHSMCNVLLLRYILEFGAEGMILTKRSKLILIDNHIELKKDYYDKISLIPLTDKVEGVTTTGLLYPLENRTLNQVDNLGISNEFYGKTATISIKSGLLYVVCEDEG